MKKLKSLVSMALCFITCFVLEITAFAESAKEYTEADRLIFGILPIWAFLLILAAIVMLAIIIIVEIFKRKTK